MNKLILLLGIVGVVGISCKGDMETLLEHGNQQASLHTLKLDTYLLEKGITDYKGNIPPIIIHIGS